MKTISTSDTNLLGGGGGGGNQLQRGPFKAPRVLPFKIFLIILLFAAK